MGCREKPLGSLRLSLTKVLIVYEKSNNFAKSELFLNKLLYFYFFMSTLLDVDNIFRRSY